MSEHSLVMLTNTDIMKYRKKLNELIIHCLNLAG